MAKTDSKKEKEVVDFIKEAFCCDGEAEFCKDTMEFDGYFRLTDSKRGIMYVGWKGCKGD